MSPAALNAGVPDVPTWVLLLPVAILLGIVPGLVAAWWRTRRALAAYYERPLRLRLREEPPMPPGEKAAPLDAELRGLGYRPAGYLEPEEGGRSFFAVYVHESLPVFALVAMACDDSGVYSAVPHLESFLAGFGRLSTTGSATFGRLTAGVQAQGPRLVQRRAWGPATPTALDGQHVGTVRAWLAGSREFLPADAGALAGYLEADHQCVRDALSRRGGLSLGEFLRCQFGTPRGVLKF